MINKYKIEGMVDTEYYVKDDHIIWIDLNISRHPDGWLPKRQRLYSSIQSATFGFDFKLNINRDKAKNIKYMNKLALSHDRRCIIYFDTLMDLSKYIENYSSLSLHRCNDFIIKQVDII